MNEIERLKSIDVNGAIKKALVEQEKSKSLDEIERAITTLIGYAGIVDSSLGDACKLALVALREKQERVKGCEYCQSENGQGTDIWHGNQLSVGYGVYRAIKFCPMCGKAVGNEAIR